MVKISFIRKSSKNSNLNFGIKNHNFYFVVKIISKYLIIFIKFEQQFVSKSTYDLELDINLKK